MEKITQAGLDQLKQRLTDDIQLRQKISKERAEAYSRDGDGTHDNPSFHSLTAELEFVDSRIAETRQRLAAAVLISDEDVDTERIGIGTFVACTTSCTEGDRDKVVLQVVGEADSDPGKGMISHLAPVGAALLGLGPGDTAVVSLPNGERLYKVHGLFASPEGAEDCLNHAEQPAKAGADDET